MTLIAIDIGVNGAFAVFHNGILDDVFDMPTKEIITREATYKYKYKNKNTVIKSGKNKGERPRVIRSLKKTKTVVDFSRIKEIFEDYSKHGEVKLVSETQFAIAHGKTIYKGHGVITGIAMCYCDEVVEITPQSWQKYFGYNGSDKEKSMELAQKLFEGWEFSRHDAAEAALIGKYFLDN